MRYLHKVAAIAIKDLRAEARTRDLTPAMLVYSLIVIVVFNFVFEPGVAERGSLAPGVLMIAFTFAGMLGLSRSFAAEREEEALRGLVLAPMDRSAIYLGKLLSNLAFLFGIALTSLLAVGFFFNLDILRVLARLALVLLLAILGFVAVGTIYAGLASNIRFREVLLPILLFPVIVPILIAAVNAMGMIMRDRPMADASQWLRLMVGYDAIFVIVGVLIFDNVVRE